MEKDPVKVIIDTNVLISAIIFGGIPEKIIKLIQENKINAITSSILISELLEILVKKFHFTSDKLYLVEELIKENFIVVHPTDTVDVVRDKDDNRVIEAAIQGNCKYIITGDRDLLVLKLFQNIEIVTPEQFLKR